VLDRYCQEADWKPASTNKLPAKEQNGSGKDRSWWLKNRGTCPPYDSPRSIAYLRAYIEFGEPIFYATGIPLADGYLHPDRAVMKAMLLGDCVVLNKEQHSRFELTEKGRALLAEVPLQGSRRVFG
jgi:hypothetical protein